MQTKFLLSGIVALTVATPAFALRIQENISAIGGGVGGSTTCDNATLGQSDNNSTANVEANWNANRININWFDGNEQLATTLESSYCMYDGVITLPQQPTKTGYTFNGWVLSNRCSGVNNAMECNGINGCDWNLLTQSCENSQDIALEVSDHCAEISNESECSALSSNYECFWVNNACTEPIRFCEQATTESECTQHHNQIHAVSSDVVCFWSAGSCGGGIR